MKDKKCEICLEAVWANKEFANSIGKEMSQKDMINFYQLRHASHLTEMIGKIQFLINLPPDDVTKEKLNDLLTLYHKLNVYPDNKIFKKSGNGILNLY
jgi:hypothetical protein